jgi:hypothetical protein
VALFDEQRSAGHRCECQITAAFCLAQRAIGCFGAPSKIDVHDVNMLPKAGPLKRAAESEFRREVKRLWRLRGADGSPRRGHLGAALSGQSVWAFSPGAAVAMIGLPIYPGKLSPGKR